MQIQRKIFYCICTMICGSGPMSYNLPLHLPYYKRKCSLSIVRVHGLFSSFLVSHIARLGHHSTFYIVPDHPIKFSTVIPSINRPFLSLFFQYTNYMGSWCEFFLSIKACKYACPTSVRVSLSTRTSYFTEGFKIILDKTFTTLTWTTVGKKYEALKNPNQLVF